MEGRDTGYSLEASDLVGSERKQAMTGSEGSAWGGALRSFSMDGKWVPGWDIPVNWEKGVASLKTRIGRERSEHSKALQDLARFCHRKQLLNNITEAAGKCPWPPSPEESTGLGLRSPAWRARLPTNNLTSQTHSLHYQKESVGLALNMQRGF